jgi:hypothetical protein
MATAKKSPARKPATVTFAKVKADYLVQRSIDVDTEKAVNAHKAMRGWIRANRAKLVKAGWSTLADHQHGAPYGDVPVNIAKMIVTRKVDVS